MRTIKDYNYDSKSYRYAKPFINEINTVVGEFCKILKGEGSDKKDVLAMAVRVSLHLLMKILDNCIKETFKTDDIRPNPSCIYCHFIVFRDELKEYADEVADKTTKTRLEYLQTMLLDGMTRLFGAGIFYRGFDKQKQCPLDAACAHVKRFWKEKKQKKD